LVPFFSGHGVNTKKHLSSVNGNRSKTAESLKDDITPHHIYI